MATLLASPAEASAQSFLGFSLTRGSLSLNGDAPPNGVFRSRPSYAVRATGGYEVAEGVHLLTHPGLTRRSAAAEYVVPGPTGSDGIGYSELEINYVSIPVGFRIESTNDGIYVSSMLAASYLLEASYTAVTPTPFDEPQQTPEQDALPNLNEWDFSVGLAVGGQFRIGKPRLVVELQWGQSLVNVTNPDSQPVDWAFPRRFKYSGFSLNAGLEFDLGGGDSEDER